LIINLQQYLLQKKIYFKNILNLHSDLLQKWR